MNVKRTALKVSFNLCLFFMTILFFIYFKIEMPKKSSNCEEDRFVKRHMKGPLSAFDPGLIQEVVMNYLDPPSTKEYNLYIYDTGNEAKIYNHGYQKFETWSFLNTTTRILFPPNPKHKGFYVEVGAFDGEYLSNSLFLELEYGWNGLLIEPDKGLYKSLLKKNRKAWSSNCCLSSNPYPHETILSVIDSDKGSILSFHERIYNSISESRTNKVRHEIGFPVYENVQCIPLHTLLLALNQTHVDLIYLDVEDVEVDLLKHFAWDKIHVDVWIVEHRNPESHFGVDYIDPTFIKWFESKGHVLYKVAPYVLDYIFIRNNSIFYEKNHKRLGI